MSSGTPFILLPGDSVEFSGNDDSATDTLTIEVDGFGHPVTVVAFFDEPPTDEPPTDEPPTDQPPTDQPPTDEPAVDPSGHEHSGRTRSAAARSDGGARPGGGHPHTMHIIVNGGEPKGGGAEDRFGGNEGGHDHTMDRPGPAPAAPTPERGPGGGDRRPQGGHPHTMVKVSGHEGPIVVKNPK